MSTLTSTPIGQTSRTAEDVVTELWNLVFGPRSDSMSDTGKAGAPTGATH